ncbi:MAG: pentapeptide repeat-containing protein [Microcoleaceae cyanobacterium]
MTYRCTYDDSQPESFISNYNQIQDIEVAQEVIYDFFIEVVKQWHPDAVLDEFENLFFLIQSDEENEEITHALNRIVFDEKEDVFVNTIKRVCYILVNNWYINRDQHSIRTLLGKIEEVEEQDFYSESPTINRLRKWLIDFAKSEDYQEIRQCALQTGRSWSSRYTSYLLVSQYVNPQNSIEQQELARNLSKQLKDKYKFDLAMYIVRQESSTNTSLKKTKNPTKLGDNVITLIKKTLSSQRVFSHTRQAELFLESTKNLKYSEFKAQLPSYLMLQENDKNPTKILRDKLNYRLETLYSSYDKERLEKGILIRTCNRLIEFLTTEDGITPSSVFVLLNSHGNPLTLVTILLKLILICTASRTYLEVCIAKLIEHYQNYEEEQCQSFIRFLEVFNLVFTIFTENVQYHLVKIDQEQQPELLSNLDAYRLFCQTKGLDLRGRNLSGIKLTSTDLREANLRDTNLSGINLIQADLKLANLSKADLSGSVLNEAKLLIADLSYANLTDSNLIGADLRRANLQHTTLVRACLTSALLNFANLRHANLATANLMATRLDFANLSEANLNHANLQYSNLCHSHFRNADLSSTNLKGVNLCNADLTGANLSNADLRGADLSGANLSNANLDGANLGKADCRYANFSQANLKQANLNYANLEFVNFTKADLSYVVLRHANLYQGQLTQTNLYRADLTRTDLSHADFREANLCCCLIRHAKLTRTCFNGTNLRGANLFGSNVMDARIKDAKFGNNSGLSDRIKRSLNLKNKPNPDYSGSDLGC